MDEAERQPRRVQWIGNDEMARVDHGNREHDQRESGPEPAARARSGTNDGSDSRSASSAARRVDFNHQPTHR